MYFTSKIIKETAKKQLKCNWSVAIIVALVLVLTFSLAICLPSLIMLVLENFATSKGVVSNVITTACYCVAAGLALIMVFPIMQGVVRWYWFLGLDKEQPVSEVFYYFSAYKLWLKAFTLGCRMAGNTLFAAVIVSLPLGFAFGFLKGTTAESLIPVLEAAVILMVALFMFVRYSVAPVAIILNENVTSEQAMAVSKQVISGNTGKCFIMVLSFVGWILLSFLGIPLVYTLPFMFTSYVIFVRFVIINHRSKAAKSNLLPYI